MCKDGRRCGDCNKGESKCCNKCEVIMRYEGPDIDCVGVTTGDTYETVIGKLSDFTCNSLSKDGVGIANITYDVGTDTMTINMTDGTSNLIIGLKGPKIIESTHGNLIVLRNSNSLVKGQLYLMTDFQTIYDQPDYSDAATPKTTVATKTGAVDPIILLAISTTEFAKEVWRPSTPKHTLEYDISFSQTEVMGAPTKGRITYCKDEFDNETHYDHTVVLLKRYESVNGSGIFNSFWDTGFGSTEVLTFGAGSLSNKIGGNYYTLAGGFAISNNILKGGSVGNTIGTASTNNTFGNGTYDNAFGDDTNGNTFGDFTNNNTFGNTTTNNTFGDSTVNNAFGNFIQGIDFTISPIPTHVYGGYPCNIFKRQDGTVRLSYYDNSDVLVVAAPTD